MDGILLLDKPAGLSSHDVVSRLRRLLATRAVGHAGTLDPQATGLLVVAVGSATRWLPYLPADKVYRATVRLGLATDTEDIWGQETAADAAPAPAPEAYTRALLALTGLTEQVPPMFSALKQDGRKLYELARLGQTVERKARPMAISAVRVLALRGQEADFEVDCGGGTYVRSLCVEVGRSLGRPACMAALRRLRSGNFSLDQALPQERWLPDTLAAALLGPAQALGHLPGKDLDDAEAGDVAHGRSVAAPSAQSGTWRLHHQGRLLALADADPSKEGRLFPRRVFQA
jgi:tRNA pseudouridine55 synthase